MAYACWWSIIRWNNSKTDRGIGDDQLSAKWWLGRIFLESDQPDQPINAFTDHGVIEIVVNSGLIYIQCSYFDICVKVRPVWTTFSRFRLIRLAGESEAMCELLSSNFALSASLMKVKACVNYLPPISPHPPHMWKGGQCGLPTFFQFRLIRLASEIETTNVFVWTTFYQFHLIRATLMEVKPV